MTVPSSCPPEIFGEVFRILYELLLNLAQFPKRQKGEQRSQTAGIARPLVFFGLRCGAMLLPTLAETGGLSQAAVTGPGFAKMRFHSLGPCWVSECKDDVTPADIGSKGASGEIGFRTGYATGFTDPF